MGCCNGGGVDGVGGRRLKEGVERWWLFNFKNLGKCIREFVIYLAEHVPKCKILLQDMRHDFRTHIFWCWRETRVCPWSSLVKFYLANIIFIFDNVCDPVNVHTCLLNTNCHLFADDSVLLSKSVTGLNHVLICYKIRVEFGNKQIWSFSKGSQNSMLHFFLHDDQIQFAICSISLSTWDCVLSLPVVTFWGQQKHLETKCAKPFLL